MKILNILKGKKSVSRIKLAAVALLGATLAGSLTAGVATLPAVAMNTASNTVTVSGGSDIYNAQTGKFDQTALSDLLSKMTGQSTYSGALSYLNSQTNAVVNANAIYTRNGNKDIVVEFGGYKWTVTYLSKDGCGNMIATLWYADTEDSSMFSDNWYNADNTATNCGCDDDYYSNSYGMSLVRSTGLNIGSSYYHISGATGSIASSVVNASCQIVAGTAQNPEHRFALFTMQNSEKGIGVVDYLVTPSQVAWQATQYDTSYSVYHYPNDSYLEITTTGAWIDRYTGKNFQTREGYSDWANDPIWLPSLSETGTSASSASGMWKTSPNQRKSGSGTSNSWLRSGSGSKAGDSYTVTSTGAHNGYNTQYSYGVRPALHLNLTAATGNELWDFEEKGINQVELQNLISKISGDGSYTSLQTAISNATNNVITAEDIRALNSNNDITVTFGGFSWTVTYVSVDMTGNIITTLWYNGIESLPTVYSDNWRSGTASGGYASQYKYSNHYGGSYLRAIELGNGGQYYTATGDKVVSDADVTTVTTTLAQAQASKYYNFAQGAISSFLVAPNAVPWQQDQYGLASTTVHYQNENLVYSTAGGFSSYPNIMASQSDPLYYQWGNDLVWIPSSSEVGNSSKIGIWHASSTQRSSSSSTTYSWLRTGYYSSAAYVYGLSSSGTDDLFSTYSSYGVRPAIHLNITKSIIDGGEDVNSNLRFQNAWNSAIQESLTSGSKQVTFTLTDNWYALPDEEYTTSFGEGIGFQYGALYVPAGANVVLDLNSYTIDRSLVSAVNHGNVINNIGALTISDSSSKATGTITGGASLNGGGVLVNSGTAIVNSGNFIRNLTATNGGVIYSTGILTINGGVFESNRALSIGGALSITSKAEINGGIFKNNTADSGGAIGAETSSNVIINDCVINGNSATNGGGLFSYRGTFIINSGSISGNIASSAGGGGYLDYGTFEMNGGEAYGNKATTNGGFLCVVNNTSILMSDGSIFDNTASFSGGAIYMDSSNFEMQDGTITDNVAVSLNGGGICLASSSMTINGGIISNNSTNGYGGAIAIASSGTVKITGGIIVGNSAESYGGGMHLTTTGKLEMTGGTIVGNSSKVSGGGIHMSTTSVFNYGGGRIIENTVNGVKNNVFLTSIAKVTVTQALRTSGEGAAYLGISMAATTGVFTTGYSAAGNTVTDGTKYFFSDAGKTVAASGTTELQITSTASTKSTLAWKVNNAAVDGNYYIAEYTGAAYTVATSVAVTGVDEYGRPVSTVAGVGKYYFTVGTPASYYNPVFTLEIRPIDLSGADINVMNSAYTGSALTPSVTVDLGGATLVKDKDFTVTYINNINAGTATVAVAGIGNYSGVVTADFTIEKRNVEIRWGNATVEYDGEEHAIKAIAEGSINGDVLEVILYYVLGGEIVTPCDAGTYIAYAVLGATTNYKLADNATYSHDFTINKKAVEVIWSATSFVYDGSDQEPTAYYVDLDGTEIDLDVIVFGAHSDADSYQATANFTANDLNVANYTLKSDVLTYVIEKAGAKIVWSGDLHTFDGNTYKPSFTIVDLSGIDLSYYVTVEYLLDGEALSGAPSDVGKYIARATFENDNYILVDADGKVIAYSDYEFVIEAATANISWLFADATYDGNGKAPVFTFDAGSVTVNYEITYAADDGKEEYSSDLPVNAGNYIAKVVFENGNYEEVEHKFTITPMSVAVVWSGGENFYMSSEGSYGSVYNYLYDSTAHAPEASATATVNGVSVELELTVAGQTAVQSTPYTATAVLADNETNKNFALSGANKYFKINKSEISDVLWYEYGQTTPINLATGEPISFQQISVYGSKGPNLSAYGVATVKGPNESMVEVTVTAYVPLTVSYSGTGTSINDYWKFGTYTATASVASNQSQNTSFASNVKNTAIPFDVTDKQLETVVATIEWAYVGAKQDAATGVYYWTYDSDAHAPEARLVLDVANYDEDDPTTYRLLDIGGAKTDAGKYYAYILPCEYDIEAEDADCYFEIRAVDITIVWTGNTADGGNFEWTYDGGSHAPTAVATGTNGLPCNIDPITEYINAGTYTAVAVVSKNFNIISGATQEFEIKQLVLDASDVVWTGTGDKSDFVWTADGGVYGPEATLSVAVGNDVVSINLAIVGKTSAVGTHTAYATLDSAYAVNANFVLTGAQKQFTLETSAISSINWEGEDANGEIIFVYDGVTEFCPKAYYYDSDFNKIYFNVIGGRTEAGEYVAYITDKTGLSNGMTHAFTIAKQQLTVEWHDTSAVYDGNSHAPTVTLYDSLTKAEMAGLVLGVDYTVTSFTTAGNYTAEICFLNNNYTVVDGTQSNDFTITPMTVNIVWRGNTENGKFEWEYDGNTVFAPTITNKITVNGEAVEIEIIGGDVNVGTYTAYAVCTDGNIVLNNASQTFEVKPHAIVVNWTGNPDNGGSFEWEYNGKDYFAPTATYDDWNGGDPIPLEVRGERMDAGTYKAIAVLPENCTFLYSSGAGSAEQEFTITHKIITGIVWSYEQDGDESEDFSYEYDGTIKQPYARTEIGGLELSVIGGATDVGEYVATAVLPNENNYMFGDGVDTTITFTITPKEVYVIWYGKDGNNATDDDYIWDYTGEIIAPTAKFEGVDKWYDVPVNGGASSADQHLAEAIDVFANYTFKPITQTHKFEINKQELTVTWSEGDKRDYTYEYNGKAQMPVATSAEGVNFSYTITYFGEDDVTDGSGVIVGAVINAGNYLVTISSANTNYTIADDDAAIKITVTKLTVSVEWSDKTTLIYNGEPQAPKAWYYDADKQAISLDVLGARTEVGSDYEANAQFKTSDANSANYELKDGTTSQNFSIIKNYGDGNVWDWTPPADWKRPSTSTDPDDGNDNSGDGSGSDGSDGSGDGSGDGSDDGSDGTV